MFDTPLNHVPFWLVHVSVAFRSRLEAALQPFNLKAPQAVIIRAISIYGSLPLVKVARLMEFAHPSALRHIDALEKRGLIQRQPHPEDRRIKLLSLTDSGEKIASDVKRIMDCQNIPDNLGITKKEYQYLLQLLKKMHSHICSELPDSHDIYNRMQELFHFKKNQKCLTEDPDEDIKS